MTTDWACAKSRLSLTPPMALPVLGSRFRVWGRCLLTRGGSILIDAHMHARHKRSTGMEGAGSLYLPNYSIPLSLPSLPHTFFKGFTSVLFSLGLEALYGVAHFAAGVVDDHLERPCGGTPAPYLSDSTPSQKHRTHTIPRPPRSTARTLAAHLIIVAPPPSRPPTPPASAFLAQRNTSHPPPPTQHPAPHALHATRDTQTQHPQHTGSEDEADGEGIDGGVCFDGNEGNID